MEQASTNTGTANLLTTCFNGINALSGISLVTIPYAFSQVGWMSLILLVLMAIIFCYTGMLVKRCIDTNPLITTYSDIGFFAFGHIGRRVVSSFTYLELYLLPTSFLLLEGDNLHNLFPKFGITIGNHHIGKPLFTMIAALVIWPTTWFKNSTWLSYFSAGGILSYIVIIASIAWTGAGVGFSAKGKLFDFTGIPTALGLYAFGFAAHPIFPSIYCSMSERNKFFLALLIIFCVTTLGYISMGVIGYKMFGEKVLSQVTLNLPVEKISSKIAIYTVLVGPITKYALEITPLADAIENCLPEVYRTKPVLIITRTLLLVTNTVVAISFPYFGILMALVGSTLCVGNCVIIPSVCYLKISKAWKKISFELVIIICINFLAVIIVVVGTYSSLRDVIKHHL